MLQELLNYVRFARPGSAVDDEAMAFDPALDPVDQAVEVALGGDAFSRRDVDRADCSQLSPPRTPPGILAANPVVFVCGASLYGQWLIGMSLQLIGPFMPPRLFSHRALAPLSVSIAVVIVVVLIEEWTRRVSPLSHLRLRLLRR
jgi:hypothetical protein